MWRPGPARHEDYSAADPRGDPETAGRRSKIRRGNHAAETLIGSWRKLDARRRSLRRQPSVRFVQRMLVLAAVAEDGDPFGQAFAQQSAGGFGPVVARLPGGDGA